MQRFTMPRRINLIIIVGVLLIIIFPPLTVFLLILVPGLGVSEIWIKYRQANPE